MHDSSAGHEVMTIELNHTIVYSRNKRVSSDFLAGLFGLPSPVLWGPFLAIEVANKVTLDFRDADGEIDAQHYCFLVGEDEFDEIFGRNPGARPPILGRPGPRQTGRDQHPRRRPGRLLR